MSQRGTEINPRLYVGFAWVSGQHLHVCLKLKQKALSAIPITVRSNDSQKHDLSFQSEKKMEVSCSDGRRAFHQVTNKSSVCGLNLA